MSDQHDLHGKVINYSDIQRVIYSRKKYINTKQTDKTIADGAPLLFLPTYLLEKHLQSEKYGSTHYKIILIGVCEDGRRIAIILDDIEPYFEVRIPENADKSAFIKTLRAKLNADELTRPCKTSTITGKPFKYYQEKLSTFVRFYYDKATHKSQPNRAAAIRFAHKEGYETATDDLSCYYRVVCREYQTTFGTWAVLNNYTECKDEFLKDEAYRLSIQDYKPYTGEITPELMKDKTMSVCWDIETWSRDKISEIPQPENKTDRMFCLSMTFHWVNQQDPFLKICLCDLPAAPNPEYLTIVCETENNIIRGFGEIFAKMRPEFIFGFNDSDYDWRWVVIRASQTKGLLCKLADCFDATRPFYNNNDVDVLKYSYKKESIKIEADTYADGSCLTLPGYIPVDVRTIFRRLYPTSEQSSLKFYLSKNKLGGKDDMPYERLFSIYREFRELSEQKSTGFCRINDVPELKLIDATAQPTYERLKQELAEINKYCIVDARRCHDLMKKRFVITDNREVSHLSFVSLFDSFYRANGMKVRNLTIAKGQQSPFNIRFTNTRDADTEDGKYPGALVFPPKKGLKTSKLSISERIAKAQLTQGKPNAACQEWLDTSIDDIAKYYDIINEHGPNLTPEQVAKLDKIPKRFKDFLLEPTGRPIAGLDFSSLYPSLIRAYNFSPEYCVLDKKKAMELNEAGHKITKVDFEFNARRRVGYFIWHDNQITPTVLVDGATIENKNFKFGVYPYILNDLFDKRASLKKKMKPFAHAKEEMEAKINIEAEKILESEHKISIKIGDLIKGSPEEATANKIIESLETIHHTDQYLEDMFQLSYLNSKQNALKVFMNTFYGEAGSKLSPFFVLEVAGGITSYGVKNLRLGYEYVTNQGCNVYYGDTDSIYLSVPESTFSEIDRKYYTANMSKLEYWTKLVELSFTNIKSINQGVNEMFLKDNGTKFLSMAYEEFLYPVAFTAKKKYFGIAHENIVNFKPKDLFIRGLDIKKRGVCGLLRKIFNEIMWSTMSIDNVYTLLELVQLKIDDIYNRKWETQDFIGTAVYKPLKNNVKVKTFVARMKDIGIDIKPYERFNYVIAKKYPYYYDLRGRKIPLSVGDKIELTEQLEKQNMQIDIDHYMSNTINGQLGRLVAYHDMFHVDPINNTTDELKIAEDKIYKNACKFIDQYCERHYTRYNTFGKTYQKIFRSANKIVSGALQRNDGMTARLLSANVNFDDFENWFIEQSEKLAEKMSFGYGKEFITAELERVVTSEDKQIRAKQTDSHITLLQRVYYGSGYASLSEMREQSYRETMNVLRRRIRDNLKEFVELYKLYHTGVQTIVDIVKAKLNISGALLKSSSDETTDYKLDDFYDDDLETGELSDVLQSTAQKYTQDILNTDNVTKIICKFKELYKNIISAHVFIKRTRSVVDYLKLQRNLKNRVIMRPPDDIIKQSIKDGIEECLTANVKF